MTVESVETHKILKVASDLGSLICEALRNVNPPRLLRGSSYLAKLGKMHCVPSSSCKPSYVSRFQKEYSASLYGFRL
jgi:hypothetical protein